jgi:hypothetical protein
VVPALASSDGERSHGERYEYARSDRDDNRGHCSIRPGTEWLPVGQVAQKLEQQGYTVGKIEVSHGRYEVKVTDRKGVRFEMYVDPATADVVRRDGRN